MRQVNSHMARMGRVIHVVNFISGEHMGRFFGDAGQDVLEVAQGLVLVAQ